MELTRIKELIDDNDTSVNEIAKLVERDHSTISGWIHNYNDPRIEQLNIIANYFNVSLDYLLGLTNIRQYEDNSKEINKEILTLRLNKLREKSKLTREQFANQLGIARTTWVEYEQGHNIIRALFLYDLAKKHKISVDYLLGKRNKKYIG